MLRNRAWSHVFLRKSLYGALIAAILVSIGCQQQKAETEEKPPVPTVQLSIVIHKTLEGVVRPLISAFQEQLTGSRIVELQITSYAGFDDAQKIASGEAKNDIWFTPTAIMPKWVEAHIRNLGAPQKDCTAYGRTPLRLVGTKNMFNRTCDPEAGCLWEAVTKYFTENVREGKEDEEITFSLVPPPYGPVATLAWANLLQWDGSDMSSTLDEASDTKKTHEWLSLNPVYLPNYEAVFSRMVNAQPNEQQIAVGPEAIYLAHLQNAPLERKENLMVLPLRNRKSLSQDLMLCTSTGDWLT
ncbi:MAG: hypothetical protein KDD70_09350, partial [Bdellovibrionales bacterium]|nr:hypothetical protein [Bdellovibrionales bacterium]